MADTTENCPRSVAVPISVSVNTSGTVPPPLTNVHAASATHGGFTKISEFTFTAKITGESLSMQDYFSPKLSNTTAVWDFGDGYSLSATNTITTKYTSIKYQEYTQCQCISMTGTEVLILIHLLKVYLFIIILQPDMYK